MGLTLGAVAVMFLRMYRGQISGILDRAWRIKFPGGELTATQRERVSLEQVEPGVPSAALAAGDVALPPAITVTPAQAEEIAQLIRSERSNAALWEYRYLNLFLVRSTQLVLEWLATQPEPVSLRFADSLFQAQIPDANERTAIANVLQSHHLITVAADAIRVTDKGREYLRWRGPLPEASSPAT